MINMSVEPLVRDALAAAMGRDHHRSIAALQAIADGGDQVARDSVTLATAISVTALLDLSDGEAPDEEELVTLATQLDEMEQWAEIGQNDAHTLLQALAGEKDRATLAPETFTRIIFVSGAWLLGAFGPPEAERPWYVYLDQILTRLETGPPS